MSDVDPFASTLQHWIEVFMKHSIQDFMQFARESGLSRSQLGALLHLHYRGSAGVTDLGTHLGVSSAATSQMLDRLVQQGLILRSEDPTDRRVKQIVLTDKGLQILHECIRARQSWLLDLAKILSARDKEQIERGLNILIDKANQLEQSSETQC
jgi:DNA-binding MarR family transcriptional regulator